MDDELRIEKIDEQIRFNNTIIKRIQQRNTELRYIKAGLIADTTGNTKQKK